MSIRIITTKNYEKALLKFKKAHPELRIKYSKTIKTLGTNPFHPSLRLHKLKGKHRDYYSVSINLQYRIMLDFIIENDRIILVDIGNHDYLYR